MGFGPFRVKAKVARVDGDPEVLRTGEASTAYHADLKVRQVIDRTLAGSLKPRSAREPY
jgi:hypothetical protein